LGACWAGAAVAIGWWIRRSLRRPSDLLRSHHSESHRLGSGNGSPASAERAHHFLVYLPGNEILHLDLSERVIDVPRLSPALDGLAIVHFSDFHFTGRVARTYFEEVVRRSNELQPDLVAITGDLVDRAPYIDWIPETLGRLRARHGVYFVLGNHDMKVDTDRLRRVLTDSGLIDLGGRWARVQIRGEPVILAGNELPWMAPAADMTCCPPRTPGNGPLRIVLSHSPDQLDWAQVQDADLLLAGHTHGGQIRFPWIGPIVTPTRLGVEFASGVFYAPPTILHVTRGVSGEFPVRLNCPPEMAHLTLHAGK
jgi:predicted MPP superfamily phosphohydrolase